MGEAVGSRYREAVDTENKIYDEMKEDLSSPNDIVKTGWQGLDEALDWLCAGTENVLDFGCGNGSMIFLCANRGTKNHIGIDLSPKAIECAEICAAGMKKGSFRFLNGSIEKLEKIENSSIDAVILSNTADNLYPQDARKLLSECRRILRSGGKILVKLNPFITPEEIEDWHLERLDEDLYFDGLILWNRTDEEWQKEFDLFFETERKYEFYIPEAEQNNRIFLLYKQ